MKRFLMAYIIMCVAGCDKAHYQIDYGKIYSNATVEVPCSTIANDTYKMSDDETLLRIHQDAEERGHK